MEYQRATKASQKEQSKIPSSSLRQASLNHVAVHPLLQLQRTIGNQVVLGLLRAGNVQIDPTTQAFRESRFGHDFSWIPTHSMQTAVPQTKLMVSQLGDVYEQEADQVSEQVMHMTDAESSLSDDEDEAEFSLPHKQISEPRANEVTQSSNVSPIVHDVLNSGGGQRLDPMTRAFMEPRFGHDFSKVRVHTDERAAESARAVNALAYTVEGNVIFAKGHYAPETYAGRQLLAHELTHVVQNRTNTGTIIQRKAQGENFDDGDAEIAQVMYDYRESKQERQALKTIPAPSIGTLLGFEINDYELGRKMFAASVNPDLTLREVFGLLKEYESRHAANIPNADKSVSVSAVPDAAGKSEIVSYNAGAAIEVDGRTHIGKKRFAAYKSQMQATANVKSRRARSTRQIITDAIAIQSLEGQGLYFDPHGQREVAGYKVKNAVTGQMLAPDAARFPYTSVTLGKMAKLVPFGAVVLVEHKGEVVPSIRIDAGGKHLGEISKATADALLKTNVNPRKGSISSGVQYLAIPSIQVKSKTLTTNDESAAGLTAVVMPPLREFLKGKGQQLVDRAIK